MLNYSFSMGFIEIDVEVRNSMGVQCLKIIILELKRIAYS